MKENRKLLLFFMISFFFLGVIIFYIFRPILNAMLLGFVFSYLFYPIFKRLSKKTGMPRISSFLSCVLFILIITIPMLFALNSLAVEIFTISNTISNLDVADTLQNYDCDPGPICTTVNKLLENQVVETSLSDLFGDTTDTLRSYVGEILVRLPSFFISVFIIIFVMYYMLLDGPKLIEKLKGNIPIADVHKEKLFKRTNQVMGGILFGSIVIGAFQGVAAAIGFLVFGIKAPIIWGIVTFFFSFLPFLGAGMVWFPASLYIIIFSLSTGDSSGLFNGIGLMIYGALFVSTIDNFFRPKLISSTSNIHPILILFGVIGGVSVFGAAGIIIGPLILGIFVNLFYIYESEKSFLFTSMRKKETIKKSKKTKKTRRK